MTFNSIFWNGDEARLKGFSSTSKSGSPMTVKIEIEIKSPYRLGRILEDLEEIYRGQTAADRKAPAPAPTRASSRRRAIGNEPAPLLLTYRRED